MTRHRVPRADRRRVAVTGMGAICALGASVSAIWANLVAGVIGIGPIRGIDTQRLSSGLAAEVVQFDPGRHFARNRLHQLDRVSQFALVAAREAMAQSAIGVTGTRRHGVVFGAAMGQLTLDDTYRSFYGERSDRVPPLTVPRVMPNAACSQISMEFQLRGVSFAIASACASASHAIAQAAMLIRAGQLDVAVTGGADASVAPGVLKSWEALRVLSPEGCRPFSLDRTGLVMGEGAAVLVLEGWDHAEARGAPILAELAGAGLNADGAELTAPDSAGACDAMREALDDAGLTTAEIGYVNAHGTGTRMNDTRESEAIGRVFGPHGVPLSSTKSMIGHCMSASGAIEAVATIMAIRSGVLPPTTGFRVPDPACDVDCIPNVARASRIQAALSNSLAFGGLNAVLAFRAA